jgi:hypothetical protein
MQQRPVTPLGMTALGLAPRACTRVLRGEVRGNTDMIVCATGAPTNGVG